MTTGMDKDREIILIGWGIAGVTLAWHLHLRGICFKVCDHGNNQCSRAAAGLVNPLVFKRLTKTWNIDLLMPYAFEFYSQVGNELGVELLSGKNIYYIFPGPEEENIWSSRMGDERFAPYMEHTRDFQPKNVNAPYGFGKVNTFGNLDTNLYLDRSRDYFLERGIQFESLRVDPLKVKEQTHVDFLFCEGVAGQQNPLFNYLPLKRSHGETLIIETEDLDFQEIITRNLFVLPLGNKRYKIGATYNWEHTEPIITEPGKADLLERFENMFSCTYKIVEHKAGLRPTVADRRPLLGVHPEKNNAFIFNGLGTKGVVIAPYYANHFLDFYQKGESLDPEVNIERFHRRFLKS